MSDQNPLESAQWSDLLASLGLVIGITIVGALAVGVLLVLVAVLAPKPARPEMPHSRPTSSNRKAGRS